MVNKDITDKEFYLKHNSKLLEYFLNSYLEYEVEE